VLILVREPAAVERRTWGHLGRTLG
jgi:hypothetical protein